MTVGESPPRTPGRPPSDADRWHLLDERDFLQRSLDDAAREHRAGDLSGDDFDVLVARDAARLAEVESELAAFEPLQQVTAAPDAEPAPPPRMALWRKVGIAAACGLIALGGVILVVHFVGSRQPGQAASGSVTLSQAQQIEQQLRQALAMNNRGNTKGALELYDKVLSEDPSNPAALAYAGWLQWNVGTSAHVDSLVRIGRAEIQTAVRDAPTYDEAHLFWGLVLENQDHNNAAAVSQFNDFLADGPPPAQLPLVAPLVRGAYQADGQQVPSAFSGSTPSPSAP
jgi:tetratricopeptide (TPR) repeat protein